MLVFKCIIGMDLEYETEETSEPNGKIYTVRIM